MALRGRNEQIEHLERQLGGKSHSRKYLKKVRNRLIRRNKNYNLHPKLQEYFGWEY